LAAAVNADNFFRECMAAHGWQFSRLVAKVHASQLGGEHDPASDRHFQQASNPDSMFTIPAMIEVFVECVRRGFLNGFDTIRNRLT
jgi:hypothetical protein